MVNRTGPNAIQALAAGGFRELSAFTPPVIGDVWPFSHIGAYLQGQTSFPMSNAEALNRARARRQVWTAPYVGYNPTDFNNAAVLVHSMADLLGIPRPDIYLYWMPEFQPTLRSGAVAPHQRNLWDFIDNGNFWAYDSYVANPKVKIPANGNSSYCNHQTDRTVGGFSWGTYGAHYIKNLMGLTFGPNGFKGVMTDNTQNDWTYGNDVNENGTFLGGRSAGMRAATSTAYQQRSVAIHAMGLNWAINGNSWMYIENCRTPPINDQAALANLFDVGILERAIGEYGVNLAPSQGRVFYKGGSDLRSLSSVRTYPGGATITSQPATGTRLQTVFGGWMKDFAGNNIFTGASGTVSLRGLFEFCMQGQEIIGSRENIIVQNKGPSPAQFNITSGLYAFGDYHARFAALHTLIVSNYLSHYFYQDITSPVGVMSDLDELRIPWGTPSQSSTLGLPQLTVNHGDGLGNGINGVYMRLMEGGPHGKTLLVSNPAGNGPQDIDFPVSDGVGGQWQRLSSTLIGSTPQANWNNGAVVGMGELGFPEHNASVYAARQS